MRQALTETRLAKPHLVILTGAGISKESGLDTFRDAGGLWSRVRIEDVATPEAFARDPAAVHAFYNARRRNMLSANIQPNAAHRALAALERDWAGDFLLVTQNIDDLHERAGSAKLVHMHGEMLKTRCTHCGAVQAGRADLSLETPCPSCRGAGGMRPHVVWFGEMPFEMDRIYEALARCGVFISIGTSGNVYPAAGFVAEARRAGAHTVELNLEPSEGASLFAERRYGPASEIVPAFVAALLTPGGAARSFPPPAAR
jgi:NAD-dependent deacetylase